MTNPVARDPHRREMTIEYDAHHHWLVENDGFGASQIVGRDVPPNVGESIVKRLAALRSGEEPPEGETCQSCGRRYALVWTAPDAMWTAVTGETEGGGLRCIECFDREAAATVGLLRWVPEPIDAWRSGEEETAPDRTDFDKLSGLVTALGTHFLRDGSPCFCPRWDAIHANGDVNHQPRCRMARMALGFSGDVRTVGCAAGPRECKGIEEPRGALVGLGPPPGPPDPPRRDYPEPMA